MDSVSPEAPRKFYRVEGDHPKCVEREFQSRGPGISELGRLTCDLEVKVWGVDEGDRFIIHSRGDRLSDHGYSETRNGAWELALASARKTYKTLQDQADTAKFRCFELLYASEKDK